MASQPLGRCHGCALRLLAFISRSYTHRYMCVYICRDMYVYVYIYIYVYAYIYSCAHICICTYYTYMYIHIHICCFSAAHAHGSSIDPKPLHLITRAASCSYMLSQKHDPMRSPAHIAYFRKSMLPGMYLVSHLLCMYLHVCMHAWGIWVDVCMGNYMHICSICIHVHTQIHTYTHVIHTYIYIYMYMCVYSRIYM